MLKHDQIPPNKNALYWLLASITLVLLPQISHMPIWLIGICVGVLGWRLLREIYGWSLPKTIIKIVLTVSIIIFVFISYKTLLGRDPGVALLSIMLCMKLLELRNIRDAMVTIFIGYFLTVASFFFSQSIFIGIYLFAVVTAFTISMMAINHYASSPSYHRLYFRTSIGLLIQAIPVMVLLFFFFPRLEHPLWALPDDAFSGKTGLSEELSMGSINNLANSKEVAFRVQFDGNIPHADQLYWRGLVMWYTDGRNWTPIKPVNRRLFRTPASELEIKKQAVQYTINLEPHNQHWLFALDMVEDSPEQSLLRFDRQMLNYEPIRELKRYQLQSYLQYNTGEILQYEKRLGLDLPVNINPKTFALAQQWLMEYKDPEKVVNAALDHFSKGEFFYSNKPPILRTESPVDEFLFETKTGFCEHFATSFTLLMRSAGIPARVITGYQGGELNPMGDYLIVRQSDAHAWAEVWLKDKGWIRIDPTAQIPASHVEFLQGNQRFKSTNLEEQGQFSWFRYSLYRIRHGWDSLKHFWNLWVVGFDSNQQNRMLHILGIEDLSWKQIILILFSAVFIIIALIALLLLMKHPERITPVQRYYFKFKNQLAKKGFEVNTSEGPLDLSFRASQHYPKSAAQIKDICYKYEQLRYGKSASKDSLGKFILAVKKFRITE